MVLATSVAQADPIGFTPITSNNGPLTTAVAPQFSVEAFSFASGWRFEFRNTGPIASVITQIYVDFGGTPVPFGQAISNTPGQTLFAFGPGGPGPNSLPSQNTATPPFTTDDSIKSVPPFPVTGINQGEVMSWLFFYGGAFDAAGALEAGTLRFGIHVQSIAGGGSDSYVTSGDPTGGGGGGGSPVPESSTLVLLSVALAGALFIRRK